MKKTVILLFLISLALTACSVNADVRTDSTAVSSSFESAIEEDLAYSDMINQQFDILLTHWNGSYPEYYCGCYIENRNFYILVNCNPEEVKSEICSTMGNPDVNILKAEYSYNDLMEYQDQITDILFEQQKNNEAAKHVTCIGTNEKDNVIDVEVLNMTDDIKAELQELLSSYKMVRFVNTNDRIEPL